MNRNFSLFLLLNSLLLLMLCCRKGERIEVQEYMQFRMEAFYPDTALFYQVKLNDSVLAEHTGVSGGSVVNLVNGVKGQLPWSDSARLQVTIVKKNHPNVKLDTIVYLTHNNEFLFLQLDPLQKPAVINKKLATATEIKPGRDSLKVRFFYNDDDDIRRNGNLLPSIDLQLYSYSFDSLGYAAEPKLRDEGRIKGIRKGTLSPYISIRYMADNRPRGFVAEIYPPGASAATPAQYPRAYDEVDGFIGGGMPVSINNGLFQTFRITKIPPHTQYRNAMYLFGF